MGLYLVAHSDQRLPQRPVESSRLSCTREPNQKDGSGMGAVDLSISALEDAIEVSVILL